MNYLKNNLLNIIVVLLILGCIIYLVNKPEPVIQSPIVSIVNKDSIESVIKQQYRLKLDSVSTIYNNRIYKLSIENKNLKDEIKNLNSNIGDLPDFK